MMNGYDLSRAWFNFCFENPEKIKPIHSAIFFFAVEHQNRLGGKEKFGFPSQMAMEAIGVKKYQTYGKALNDLEDWGFVTFIERSKNQYSANIISINAPTKNGIARGKALDKATIKHGHSMDQSTWQGKDSIVKPINQEPINQDIPPWEDFLFYAKEKKPDIDQSALKLKYEAWKESGWQTGGSKPKKIKNWKSTLLNTLPYIQTVKINSQPQIRNR